MILKRDYKYISDDKIRSVYLNILSKHTGKKHQSISHSSLSKSVYNSVKNDLIAYLKLNDVQSDWFINAHANRFDALKKELLDLDPTIDKHEFTYYHKLSWAFQIRQNANYGYTIFSILSIIFVLLLISISVGRIEVNSIIVYHVFISSFVLTISGMIIVYRYNIYAYKIKNDLKYKKVINKQIYIEKIKPKVRLVYFRRVIDYSKDIDSLIIYFRENNQRYKLVYPLSTRRSFFSGKTYKEYRGRLKSAIDKINKINTLVVTYNPHSRVVYKSSVDLEQILSNEVN